MLIAALSVALTATSGASAAPSGLKAVGGPAPLPAGAKLLGSPAASPQLPVSVVLASRDPAGLAALASAISTPGSPDFRSYLTVPQFARSFGAPSAHVAAVSAALRAAGLSVGSLSANGLVLSAGGTVAQVQRAFSVQLASVRLASGRTTLVNLGAPLLPAPVASDVQAVVGLSGLAQPQPGIRFPRGAQRASAGTRFSADAWQVPMIGPGPQPCTAATNEGNAHLPSAAGYTADYLATAYGLTSLYSAGDYGQGQTIGMVEFEPYLNDDIAAFATCYGLTYSGTNVNVDGGPGTGHGSGEAALDIETALAMAKHANIIVYQAPNNVQSAEVDILTKIASDNQAKVISESWGNCESDMDAATLNAENTLFQEMAVQGQTFLASSGDQGSVCDDSHVNLSVNNPASQPFVTGVGGTGLWASGSGTPVNWYSGTAMSEGVWNDGTPAGQASASGGGISSVWAMPAYQANAAGALNVINPSSSGTPCALASGYCREVPDVAADADPQSGYVIYYYDWSDVGGTSAATPLWASLIADANSSSACSGGPIGFLNPALYHLASNPTTYAADFNDIAARTPWGTGANNDAQGYNHALYPVGSGYDMATGLGTPRGAALAAALCGLHATVTMSNPGAQSSTVGQPVSLQVQAASTLPSAQLDYYAYGLPAGVTISPSTGLISGTPTAAGSTSVTVGVTDQGGNTATASFTWSVAAAAGGGGGAGSGTGSGSGSGSGQGGGAGTGQHTGGIAVGGLVSGRVAVNVNIAGSSADHSFDTLTITLPHGLSFKRSVKGIRITGAVAASIQPAGSQLKIVLSTSVESVTVSISKPSIAESRAVRRAARRGRGHHATIAVALGLDGTPVQYLSALVMI